jgi:hypothetical protein
MQGDFAKPVKRPSPTSVPRKAPEERAAQDARAATESFLSVAFLRWRPRRPAVILSVFSSCYGVGFAGQSTYVWVLFWVALAVQAPASVALADLSVVTV